MTQKMKCPVCGDAMLRETRKDTVEYKGVKQEYSQPGLWCQNDDCGEAIIKGDDSATADFAFTELRARVEGVLSPAQVKAVRVKLGLTQAEAADKFGGGVKGFAKYENGSSVPSASMSSILALVAAHPDLLHEVGNLRIAIELEHAVLDQPRREISEAILQDELATA